MVLLLSRLICALPLSWALALGRAFGWFWYHLVPVRRGVARDNLAHALPELPAAEHKRILERCFSGLGMYGVELLRLPALTPQLSEALVERENWETYERCKARGRGLIIVTAHIGNWDFFGCSQAIRGEPLHVVVKDIAFAPAHAFANAVRHRCGFQTIAPRRSKEEIAAALRQGDVVALIIDQHMAKHRAIVCELFGRLASTTPAPARFAFETGAAVLPAICIRLDDAGRHRVIIGEEIVMETPYADREANIRHNTERLNRVLETWVRTYPEQWLWLHRRWKVHDDPSGWDIPAALESLRGR